MKRTIYAAILATVVVAAATACHAASWCSTNADCGAQYYCYKLTGHCDDTGICTSRPTVCPQIVIPVCGCDNKTYMNSCTAAMAGVNVRHSGACEPTGCFDNSECPEGYYCEKTVEDCNGAGTCTQKPDACIELWDPVCGCDGQTYSNACFAAAAGVNVEHVGDCLPPGPIIVMMEPNTTYDGVHTGQSGLAYLKILWSEPIIFDVNDVNVTDEDGTAIGFAASTNNSAVMTIQFAKTLLYGTYTITVSDSAYGFICGYPIDGDGDGVCGGDAVVFMEHRMRGDLDNNNKVNFTDLAIFAESWLAGTP